MATIPNSDVLLEIRLRRLEAAVAAIRAELAGAPSTESVQLDAHYERTSAAQAAEIDARHKEVRGY